MRLRTKRLSATVVGAFGNEPADRRARRHAGYRFRPSETIANLPHSVRSSIMSRMGALRHTPVRPLYDPDRPLADPPELVGYLCTHCGMILTPAGAPSKEGTKAHEARVRARRFA